jgi:hypothetical protein
MEIGTMLDINEAIGLSQKIRPAFDRTIDQSQNITRDDDPAIDQSHRIYPNDTDDSGRGIKI